MWSKRITSIALILTYSASPASGQQVRFTFFGNSGDSLGASVAGVGDLNNDGYDDIVAGAPVGDLGFTDSGYVRAFSGKDGSILWTVSGTAANAFFGRSVAPGGDIDLDGLPEVIAGAGSDMAGAPQYAKVLSGTGATHFTVTANPAFGVAPTFGASVGGGVDLDADGFCDFVVGAKTATGPGGPNPVPGGISAGAAVIYDGSDASESVTLYGANFSDLFGSSVAMLFSPTNPQYGDVAIGAEQGGTISQPRSGSVSIWSGLSRSYQTVLYGGTDGDQFGNSVAATGDVNGDGVADLAIGAPQSGLATQLGKSGRAYVYSGANYNTQLKELVGSTPNEAFGFAVASAGNVDAEVGSIQVDELVVGVPNGNNNVSGAGNARIMRHDASGGSLGASEILRNANGLVSGERFGFALSSAGDIDRDGQRDFVIGSQAANSGGGSNNGAVYVMVSDRKKQLKQTPTLGVGITIDGVQTNANEGNNLTAYNAGDLDNDGTDDIAVGSPNEKDINGIPVGALRVYSGKQSPGGVHALIHTFVGTVSGSSFGLYARGIDDITGDGRDDLLIGAPTEDVPGVGASAGALYAFDGVTFTQLFPTAKGIGAGDIFGRSVQGVGDQNGDNVSDFAASSIRLDGSGIDRGEVRVLSGATGLPLFTYIGTVDGGYFGVDFCTISDMNGDGKREFVIGAELEAGLLGRVHLFHGGSAGSPVYSITGSIAGEAFGEHVVEVGDVNLDGKTDFAASALSAGTNGRVAVYAGGTATPTLLHAIQGDSANDKFGSSITAVGDVNLDLRPDFLVGAGEDDDAGSESGSAVLISGLDGKILERVEGRFANDYCGASVAGFGDLNGDLIPDYGVVSSNADTDGLTNNGEVRIFVRHVPPPIACPNLPAQAFLSGTGKAGTNGVPVLGVQGLPKLDKAFTITLANAPANPAFPNPNGWLVIGFSPVNLPFDAGTLLVAPTIVTPIPTTSQGTLELPAIVPAVLLGPNPCIGVSVYLQALVTDPGAPGPNHTAQSNRLQLIFGS